MNILEIELIIISVLFLAAVGCLLYLIIKDRRNKYKPTPHASKISPTVIDNSLEDDLVGGSATRKYEEEKERCSFCGNEGHTIGGCGLFIACCCSG